MRNQSVLYVAGWPLLHGPNHACRHWAAHLRLRFPIIDIVGFSSFYSGPPASAWKKLRQGVSDLATSRINIQSDGGARLITVRDIYVPRPVDRIAKEIWRFLNIRTVLARTYDVAIIAEPENALLAWLIERTGIARKLIYQDWDYHPGWEESRLGAFLMNIREVHCVRHADAVISVNPLLAELRLHQGAKEVVVVPNGTEVALFSDDRRKQDHPPTLVYAGTLSALWAVDLAISAMPILLRNIPDCRLLIVGAGPAETSLRALARSNELSNHVIFKGSVEYETLPSILAESDVGIATALPTSMFRYYASPMKIMDYMAAGLPVIASRLGQTETIIRESRGGVMIDNSGEAFAEAAIDLLTDKDHYQRLSHSAMDYAARHDWNVLLDTAIRHLVRFIEDDRFGESITAPTEIAEPL